MGKKWPKNGKTIEKWPQIPFFCHFWAIFSPFRAEGHFLFFGHFFPFLDFGPFSILCQAAWLAKKLHKQRQRIFWTIRRGLLVITLQNKGFEANRTRKSSPERPAISLSGTFSVPQCRYGFVCHSCPSPKAYARGDWEKERHVVISATQLAPRFGVLMQGLLSSTTFPSLWLSQRRFVPFLERLLLVTLAGFKLSCAQRTPPY